MRLSGRRKKSRATMLVLFAWTWLIRAAKPCVSQSRRPAYIFEEGSQVTPSLTPSWFASGYDPRFEEVPGFLSRTKFLDARTATKLATRGFLICNNTLPVLCVSGRRNSGGAASKTRGSDWESFRKTLRGWLRRAGLENRKKAGEGRRSPLPVRRSGKIHA
jgi:hypothetical protein